jgi:hypothetical protein
VLDERCELLAEGGGVLGAEVDLIIRASLARVAWAFTCPPSKWVDLPMLRPALLAESGDTSADRTAITEIRSDPERRRSS